MCRSCIPKEERRRRGYVRWKDVLEFWQLGTPQCIRCGAREDDCELAHIINFAWDGLCVPWNVAPLCVECHRSCPVFEAGQERIALRWFGLRWNGWRPPQLASAAERRAADAWAHDEITDAEFESVFS